MLWFEDFLAAPPVAELDAVQSFGAKSIITWEPWLWASRRAPVMQRLHAGVCDDHLRRWAGQLRDWGSPVHLRFGHEFNGHWYPWNASSGIAPATYVEVWRRLHDLFAREGADRVRWVWCAAAGPDLREPLEQWYPGDEYVDVVGVDGYNWGSSQDWSAWVEPAALFDYSLDEIRTLAAAKPVLITEVACAEAGGSKQTWVGTLVDYLGRQPDVTGLIWFDHDKETDWRIASSPVSAAAMAAAMRRVRAIPQDCVPPA